MALTLMTESGSPPGARVSVTNQNIDAAGGATAGYRLNSSGAAQKSTGGAYSDITNQWLLTGAAGDYECKFAEVIGTVSTGTVDTWLACSSTRTWTVTASLGTEKECRGTISIRDAVTGDVLDTATISLYSENL
jgi:hypothetical protein